MSELDWKISSHFGQGLKKKKLRKKNVSAQVISGIASTASGLARADTSPVGWPIALALMTRRMILPLLVLGTSLTK
jgi:hypothetical protein